MKKRILFIIFCFGLLSVFHVAVAQTYLISQGGTVSTCSGNFYDSGGTGNGAGADYNSNENYTITFCPSTAGQAIMLNFTTFQLENGYDFLTIYDGPSIASPLLGPETGTSLQNVSLGASSANSSGCLTLVFNSDITGTDKGWVATVSCFTPCVNPIAGGTITGSASPAKVCVGETVSFNGSTSTPGAGFNITSYSWDFGDGTTATGVNASHSYATPGGYSIQLTVTDNNGCSNTNRIDLETYVSTTPVFTGTTPSQSICLGEQACLTGVVTGTNWTEPPPAGFNTQIVLPDGSGICYSTSIEMDQFAANQTLTNINDLIDICLNLEHSWMNDLRISITCPSGNKVTLHDRGGINVYLGVPVIATDGVAGVGWDYCWNPTASNGTWSTNSALYPGASLPAGTYASVQTLSGLVGCELNGEWTLEVCDLQAIDDGTIFSWGVNLNPAIYAAPTTFTPVFGTDCASTGWAGNDIASTTADCNTICVEPTTVGTHSYIFTGIDDFGCSYDTTITITVTPSATFTASAIPVNCNGSCIGGEVSVSNASGTVAPYTYNWDNGLGNGQNKTDVCPGIYTITVTDANLCSASQTVTVNEPAPVAVTAIGTDASCFGYCDGSVSMDNATGGTSPFSYSWTGLGNLQSFNTVCAGAYNGTATDSKGCTGTTSAAIGEPSQVNGTVDATSDATCGQSNGSFTVSGSGGTPAYQFSIGSGFQASGTFSNVAAGSYNVTVMDLNGCTNTIIAVVNDLSGLTGSIASQTNIVCGGTGSVTITSSGGTLPHTYSIDGGSTYQAGTTFSNLVAGNYPIIVKDASGCTVTVNVSITQAANVIISLDNVTEATCGLANGALIVSASSGTLPYEYSIDGTVFQPDGAFNGLIAGTYNVIVTDANGCSDTISVTVNDLSGLSASLVSQTNASCNGYADGTATIAGSGGTSPYLYSADNSVYNSNPTFTGLSSGSYTFFVKDNNGCTSTQAVTISEPAAIVISVTPSAPEICVGNQISMTASGAATYSWSPASSLNQATGSTVNSNPSGTTTYTVIGTTASGCIGDTSVTVTVNQLPVVNITPSDPTICVGSCVTLTASGAPAIQWTPSTAISPGTNFSTVSACPPSTITYTVFGTSSEGCVGSKVITVTVVDLPTVTVTPASAAVCKGDSTTLQATGATTYEWSISGVPVSSGPMLVASPQSTTVYTCTGYHSGGCNAQTNVTVTVNNLPNVTVVPASPVICEGSTVTLTANGAVTYSWTSNMQSVGTSQSISVSPTSHTTYSVLGTNVYGCENTANATVFVNPLPVISVNPEVICNGDDVDLTASGASTYFWTDPVGGTLSSTVGQTVNASPTADITYTVIGTDNNNCSNSTDVTVTVNELPVITINPSNPSVCRGDSILLSATGATQYNWSPGNDLSSVSGASVTAFPTTLGNHTYIVTGNDPAGCVNSATVTVTVFDLPYVDMVLSQNVICFGTSLTMISDAPTATGYLWSSSTNGGLQLPVNQASATAKPDLLSSNQYNVTYKLIVTDVNGCIDSVAKSVLVNPLPNVQVVPPAEKVCIGENVVLSASGADTYLWTPNLYLNTNVAATVTATPSASNSEEYPLTYIVEGNSLAGCQNFDTVSFIVRSDIIIAIALGDNSICEGMDANIAVSASGGLAPYVYSWQNSIGNTNTISFPGDSATKVSPTATETYTVTVWDACTTPSQQQNVVITVNPTPEADFEFPDGCAPLTGTFINNSSILGNCTWEFDDGTFLTNDCSPTKEFKAPDVYEVTLTVIDTNYSTGCKHTVIKPITVHDNPTASFIPTPQPAMDYNPVVMFNSSNSNPNILTYMWDFAGLGSDSLPVTQPVTSFAFPDSGHYPVQLVVVDSNGCFDTIIEIIIIEPDWGIYIPSGFTPNNHDGLNDAFAPKGYGIAKYELLMFDRWGNMIFTTGVIDDPKGYKLPGWDGKITGGSGEIAQADVYVYMIKFTTVKGENLNRKGHVTLLR